MIRLFIIGLLFLMPLVAHSQPPSPSPTKSIEKPNARSEKKQPTTNIASQLSATIPHKPSSISTNEEHENKSSPDWWLVGFTGGLFLITGILAWYTARLWQTTKKSLDITKESVDLAKKELILTQRPILRVSTIIISRTVLSGEKPGLVAIGKPVNGQFYVANVGGTPATITNIGCWVHAFSTPLPMKRPYEGENGNITITQILNPGESTPITFISEPLGVDHQSVMVGTFRIYVMGWIEYRDDLKINRRLNFCRVYRATDGRFFPVDDTDYESQY